MKNLVIITELISKLEFSSHQEKNTNLDIAIEIYDKLLDLRVSNYDEYVDIIDKLKIIQLDDAIENKQMFLQNLSDLVVPKDRDATILNIVENFKSEDGYYQANKTHTDITINNKALSFLLDNIKDVKLLDMSVLLGASISGVLNEQYDLLQNPTNNGLQLWKNTCSQIKSFFCNFSNIDKDYTKAFIEQASTKTDINKNHGNILKLFIDEKQNTIYPMIVINVENTDDQEIQYFEKMALVKKWAQTNNYENVKPLVFTGAYFNENFDGHVLNTDNKHQQHATTFLNSFKPSLSSEQKNIINNTIIFSLLSKITIPNDIHPDLTLSDFVTMNPFSSGSDTHSIYVSFNTASKLPSPDKERYLYDLILNNLVSITETLATTTGLDFTDKITKTIANNINNMIHSLDNFNLSNLPNGDSGINHLNCDDIQKMNTIGKNMKIVQSKSKGFTSLELHKTLFSRFQSCDHIMNHTIHFHDRTSGIYDYNNKSSISTSHVQSYLKFQSTYSLLNSTILRSKLKEVVHSTIEETPHFSTTRMVDTLIDIIASKEAYPETPIASLSAMQNKTYNNIQLWSKSSSSIEKSRMDFITKVLDWADTRDPQELITHMYSLKVINKNKI